MKENITDQLKNIYENGISWIKLEVEYAKLTAAEKITVLISTLILGAICALLGMVVLILLSFSLVDLFKEFMSPALSCLTVSAILVFLILLIFIFRAPLLENPISRLISKLILDIKPRNDHEQEQ